MIEDVCVTVPKDAVVITNCYSFDLYMYENTLDVVSYLANEGFNVDCFYYSAFTNAARIGFFGYDARFTLIGQAKKSGTGERFNMIEIGGFDECHVVTFYASNTDDTAYVTRFESVDSEWYTMSRCPEDSKGIVLLPIKYTVLKGYNPAAAMEIKKHGFTAFTEAFKELHQMLQEEGERSNHARHETITTISQALHKDIDSQVLWNVYKDLGAISLKFVQQSSEFRKLLRYDPDDGWTEKTALCLLKRVDLMLEFKVQY